MKIAVVDSYYPDFIASLKRPHGTYSEMLDWTLKRCFGTFDAYSRHFRAAGHEVIDIIANDNDLQIAWNKEHPWPFIESVIGPLRHIYGFNPTVLFLQDLSLFTAQTLSELKRDFILAAQCSCRFDDDERLKQFDILFTSFPFYVERFKKLGVRGIFLPLAFDPIVLQRATMKTQRKHVSLVGGYGRHWQMDDLFVTLAERTPIEFWGYGFEKAPDAVKKRYRGPAWGVDMYEIYLSSYIVLNRHGAIAGGYSNNLRLFEATGCGAMMLTEESRNIRDYFLENECVTYTSPADAAEKINYALRHVDWMERIAANGQQRTLKNHTYAQRIPQVVKELETLLVKA
jgi:spore maturation protein CgeB